VWSDEFSGPDGSPPDSSKWTFDTGGNGWGNNEFESYTSRTQNAQLKGGKLVITAQKETYTGADGIARNYTSARMKTQGLFSQAYGRFEARIKIPAGQGIWHAFRMLGKDISSIGWPKCGEIDIMENIGREPGTVHGSLHGPSTSGPTSDLTAPFSLRAGQKFDDDFHLYAVEWEPGTVRFYVNSSLNRSGPPAARGFLITSFSSSSTLQSAVIGPPHPTAPRSSPSKCSSITSAFTRNNNASAVPQQLSN
jgi:beta-glucanase (GH16 family)